jgi:hypothetical protein
VTVNLLRNATDGNGLLVRRVVDTFTAAASPAGAWSGSFTKHAPSGAHEQIEVNASGGTGAPPLVTVGSAPFLPAATAGTAHIVDVNFGSALDGNISIASDGSTLHIGGGSAPWSVSVDGTVTGPQASDDFPFAANHLTKANAVLASGTFTDASTTVTFSDWAPLLTPVAGDDSPAPPPAQVTMPEPECTFYLVTSEIVCRHLTPGSYTVTQVRGGSNVASQPLTVPARTPTPAREFLPSEGSAALSGVAAGDQLKLTSGAHVLSTLSVNPMTIQRNSPFGDINNGANATLTGSCVAGVFFNVGRSDLCVDGTIPATSDAVFSNTSLGSVNAVGRVIGQLDDTSAGSTEVDMPSVAYQTPLSQEGIRTPFAAFALARYNEPAAIVAADNARAGIGQDPRVTSTASVAPVQLSFAPFGSSAFVSIGNANQAGGVVIGTLAPGPYVDRFALFDSRGDSNTFESSFVAQANPPSPNPPSGPAATKCTAKSSGGLKAIATAAKKGKAKGKKKKKKPNNTTDITLTLSCSGAANGRIAVWLQRGSGIVADASGVVRGGVARITIKGKFPRGTYRLFEVIDVNGQATESTQILTLTK